jgi:mersacidin/lichenicidin family type 2 lantibiotic
MKKIQIARAFRDEDYYLSLTEDERASLPTHPSELVSLDPQDLRAAAGGVSVSCDNSCHGTAICTPCNGHPCA